MIWISTIALCIGVCAYIFAPLLAPAKTLALDTETQAEIDAYRSELRAMSADDPQRAALQARLLDAAKRAKASDARPRPLLPTLLSLGLIAGALGIYTFIGTPNFTPIDTTPIASNGPSAAELDDMIGKIAERLEQTPEDSVGWTMYGRALMMRGNVLDAFAAYEKALELTDNDPEIAREFASAKAFAAQSLQAPQRGPSADDIANAQEMTADDRNAMILSMVEGLRARLSETPNDPAGWTQLLKSRKVLGQDAAAADDIADLRAALPDQADAIIEAAGW